MKLRWFMTEMMMQKIIYFILLMTHIKKKCRLIVCMFYLEGIKQSGPVRFAATPQHGSGRVHSAQEQTQQTHVPKSTTLPFLGHCLKKKKQKKQNFGLWYIVYKYVPSNGNIRLIA